MPASFSKPFAKTSCRPARWKHWRWVTGAIAVLAIGCAARVEHPLPEAGDTEPEQLNVEQLRARLDRDGNGSLDADLPIARFTFNHAADIMPFIEAAKVETLHTRLTFDTGTSIVIPAGHPVDSLMEVLLSPRAMDAHGARVLNDAADAAGFAKIGDVLAFGGDDQTAEAGETVELDGSGSMSFGDEGEISFVWRQVAGVAVDLADAETAVATFVVPDLAEATTIEFELTVTAGSAEDTDVVSVVLTPATDEDEGETPADDIAMGEVAYAANGCAACHAEDASGGSGPELTGERTEALETRFGGGTAHFGSTLTDEEVAAVAAWLASLAGAGEEPEDGGPCAGADATAGGVAYADSTCAVCHGSDALGGSGPALAGGDRTAQLEARFGPDGASHFGTTLTESELGNVACWLSTLEP